MKIKKKHKRFSLNFILGRKITVDGVDYKWRINRSGRICIRSKHETMHTNAPEVTGLPMGDDWWDAVDNGNPRGSVTPKKIADWIKKNVSPSV